MQSNKHHPFSPSCLSRRELCPGSWSVELNLPDTETPEAASGTRIHKAVEMMLTLKEGESFTMQIEESEAELARKCVAKLKEINLKGLPIECEKKVCYYTRQGDLLYSGIVDVIFFDKEEDCVTIVDWKSGFNTVTEAKDNLQGGGYALAGMQEYQCKKARVIFYNPRIEQFSQHLFTDWRGIYDVVNGIIQGCIVKDAPLRPSENACKYCKGALSGACPALQSQTLGISVSAKAGLIEQLKDLSDEKALELYEACKPAQKLIDAIESEIKERAEKNGSCGDYVIKMVSGGYECKDIQNCFRVSGLTPDSFLNCCAVSLPKLKKQYADTAEGITKKEAEALLMDKIAPYLQAKQERKTLTKKKA